MKIPQSFSIQFKVSIFWLALMFVLAVFQPWITTDAPWYCKAENDSQVNGKEYQCDYLISAPVPFYPNEIRLNERLASPGAKTIEKHSRTHYLGTDNLGRDVAAGLLKGLRQALGIGLGSMTLCILVGFFLGAAGAWYGDLSIRWSKIGTWLRIFAIVYLCSFIGYMIYLLNSIVLPPSYQLILWGFAIIPPIALYQFAITRERKMAVKFINISVPIDNLLNRFIEVFQSLPALLLLLAITAIIGKHTAGSLILVLFLIRWPLATRFIRAEVLTLKEKAFLEHSALSGISIWKILFREVLPNTYAILIALFAFGVSTAILLEATLTFLGLGLPLEQVSWGSLILHGRQNPQAWWLVIFPGLMILFTLLSLLIIGEEIQSKYGPKGKRIRF